MRLRERRPVARATLALAAVGLLAGVTACGGKSGGNSPTTSSSTSSTKALATFATLRGKATTVRLDSAFTSKLAGFHVTLAPQGKATYDMGSSTLAFPITAGHATFYPKGAATPDVQGEFDHVGSSLKLTAGQNVVTVEDVVIKTGADGGLSGKILVDGKAFGTAALTLFDLDQSTGPSPTVAGGVATVSGATLYVSPTAAAALNAVLNLSGTDALPTTKNAFEFGTLTIEASGS